MLCLLFYGIHFRSKSEQNCPTQLHPGFTLTTDSSMENSRDVELKDFLFDSQLLVPKIVRELDPQLPRPKNCQTPNSWLHIPELKDFSFDSQISTLTPKIVRESNSQLPGPKNRQTPDSQFLENSILLTTYWFCGCYYSTIPILYLNLQILHLSNTI